MPECMPCIVKQIGERVGMNPIAWWEYPERIVIVFEQGPKLTFERLVEQEPEPAPLPKRKPRKAKK
jgi:hypothetical protein